VRGTRGDERLTEFSPSGNSHLAALQARLRHGRASLAFFSKFYIKKK
jgi:hypothetical protein